MNYGKNDNLNRNNDRYGCQTYYVMYFTYPLYPLAWSSQHSSEEGTLIIPSLHRWENWDVEVMRIAQGHKVIKEGTGIHIPSAKLQNQLPIPNAHISNNLYDFSAEGMQGLCARNFLF